MADRIGLSSTDPKQTCHENNQARQWYGDEFWRKPQIVRGVNITSVCKRGHLRERIYQRSDRAMRASLRQRVQARVEPAAFSSATYGSYRKNGPNQDEEGSQNLISAKDKLKTCEDDY